MNKKSKANKNKLPTKPFSRKAEKEIIERVREDREANKDIIYGIIDSRTDLTEKEKRSQHRSIRKAKVLFRAIDIMFAAAQNSCPYVTKKNEKDIVVENDIVYDERLPSVCRLDFYKPKDGNKIPALILVHGGGFTAGDKKYRKGRAQFFSCNGFAVFAVNYGLAPDHFFPQPLQHLVNAANFIYDNAERFDIDSNRIFVGGDSAGGYYASMLAAYNCTDELEKRFGVAPKFKFFGAIFNCGVYDIDSVLDKKYPFRIEEGILLGLTGISSADIDRYEYRDCCVPIKFINGKFPPTFLIFSDNDIFCGGQGDLLVEKLQDAGVYCEYYNARDILSNHCYSLTWSSADAVAANELMMSFARRLAADKIKF